MNTERNSLECQVKSNRVSSTVRSTVGDTEALKTERDALKLDVGNVRSLHEEVAALNKQLDNVITDQLPKERDDLIFESKRQAADMEAMQKDNDALKRETEYLRSQCNNVAAIKEQLKTVTAEQQCRKEVRDAPQVEMEHPQGQYKDTSAMMEQKEKLALQGKHQASDTKAVEKARDALEFETNDLRGQCKDAAALKEQLNIVTVQRPKLRKGRSALVVIVSMLILCLSVGLLWTLRDSLNSYGTPLASLYRTSSSHNSILATAVPSHNIVV
jgi:hypothetical protein